MATISNIQCPWKKFYKQAVKCMKSLHIETCKPQIKIARFMYAVKHNFASTTMDLTKDSKKSTKQLQGSKSVMFKIMAQNPSSSTSYSDTDSAYSTEADTDSTYSTEVEINYTEHLPRPPCISKPTKQHLKTHPVPSPRSSKSQQTTKCNQGTRPSCIPIPTKSISKPSHPNTSTHLPKPSTSTRPNTQTTAKQPTVPAPETSTASTYQQHKRKTPLLPTPPAPARQFYNSNHYKQHFAGPSAVNNRNSTFSRPATVISRPPPRNNYRFHQNSYISRPHTPEINTQQPPLLPRPSYQCQNIMTGPYPQHQQTQGHFFTRPYQQQQPHGHFPQPVYNIHISLPYYTT